METVLVTGATGLVGSNLCKTLIKTGYKVKALVRKSSDKSFLDTLDVEYVYSDLRDAEGVKEATKGIDKVFHCAAQIGGLKTYDDNHASINIQGTKNILEASSFNNVKKFIYISTLGVLGILRDHYNENEDMPYIKVGMPYYDTKIDSERLVVNYYNDRNLPTVIIRPGFIYGPRDRNGLPNLVPYLLKKQVVYVGTGNNDIALTSVENLTQALLLAAEKDESIGQIYNITDDQGITSNQLTKEICQTLNIKEPTMHLPIGLANGIAKTVHEVCKVLNRDTPLSEYTIALMSNNFHFDITKARTELGYDPTENFESNLKEAVESYLENNEHEVKSAKNDLKSKKVTAVITLLGLASFTLAKYLLKRKNR